MYESLPRSFNSSFCVIGFAKVLICGGFNPETSTCEVINLESSATTCKNPPNFPASIYAANGGWGLQKSPIICGGIQNLTFSNRCYSLENNEWVSSFSMNSTRMYATSAQFEDGKILVTGGLNTSPLNSVEILTEQGWESQIPSLQVSFHTHCMDTVNSTTVLLIAGLQNDQFSGKTYYFTFEKEIWIEGPELKYKRQLHSCGKIRRNKDSKEMSIIVAGGYNGSSYLSSVEILDEGSNEWKTGPELLSAFARSQMIGSPDGGVVLIGGDSASDPLSIYQLPHGDKDAVWTKMDQKLKIGRSWHTAFLVPDNIVDCS